MEAQAMLTFLLFGLITPFAIHAYVSRRLCTGQTAFTGMWLLSVVFLIGYPTAWRYLTWAGISIMVAAHFAYMIGSLAMVPKSRGLPTVLEPTPPLKFAIRFLYWSTLVLAIVGVGMLIAATGAWQIVNGVSAAAVRYVEFDPTTIPTLPRVLSNFLLVPVTLSPVMSVVSGARRPRVRFYVLPFLCLLGQSVAFGGRGGVTFGGLLLVWGFATSLALGYFAKLDRRTLMPLAGLVLALLAYSQGIFVGRQEFGDQSGFGEYLGLPIPAGCEAIAESSDLPVFGFGLDNLAPVREGLRAAGVPQDNRVDELVVFVPVRYNVYTYILEGIQAYGYAGVLLMTFAIGLAAGWLENKRQTLTVVAARSLVYCYLGMTLFADLAFFYTGWSVAFLAVAVGVPPLVWFASPARRPVPTSSVR